MINLDVGYLIGHVLRVSKFGTGYVLVLSNS